MEKIQFEKCLSLGGSDWLFDVVVAHVHDVRFEGTMRTGDDPPATFTLIRSSTMRWFMSGDNIPADILNEADAIGKSFEEYCS